jgi:hypothetical protein
MGTMLSPKIEDECYNSKSKLPVKYKRQKQVVKIMRIRERRLCVFGVHIGNEFPAPGTSLRHSGKSLSR